MVCEINVYKFWCMYIIIVFFRIGLSGILRGSPDLELRRLSLLTNIFCMRKTNFFCLKNSVLIIVLILSIVFQNCTNSPPARLYSETDEDVCTYTKKIFVDSICQEVSYISRCIHDQPIAHSVTGGNIFGNSSSSSFKMAIDKKCIKINTILNSSLEYQIALPCRFCEDNLTNEQKDSAYVDIQTIVYRDNVSIGEDSITTNVFSVSNEPFIEKDSLNYDDYYFECYQDERLDTLVQECPSSTQCLAKVRVELGGISIHADSYLLGYYKVPEYNVAFLLLDKDHDLTNQTNAINCELGNDFELDDLKQLDKSNCHLANHINIQPIPICYPFYKDQPKSKKIEAI